MAKILEKTANAGLHNLYSSPDIAGVITSRRIKRLGM
jgi:hypothetical protein